MVVTERAMGNWLSSRRQVWILAILYAVGVAGFFVLAYLFRFNLNNIDGVSYMSIAKQYAHGFLWDAINPYWSPMVSWLMAPLIALGYSALSSFMIVNAMSAAIGVAVGTWFAWTRTNRNFFSALFFLVISLVFYAGSSFILTPDSLVATWVILFYVALCRLDDQLEGGTASSQQIYVSGAILGAVGAGGYLIKLFTVPLFIVTILIWLVVRLWKHKPRQLWSSARSTILALVATAAVAALLSAPWAVALSVKYNGPTLGTSFSFNMDRKFEPNGPGHEVVIGKIASPPNRLAVSFMEDPTLPADAAESNRSDVPEPTRTDSAESTSIDSGSQTAVAEPSVLARAKFYVSERIRAFPFYVEKIGSFAPFAVPTLVLFGLALAFGFTTIRAQRRESLAALIAGVYFLGYAAVTTASSGGGNSRYYWPIFLLATLMLSLLIPKLWASLRSKAPAKWQAALLIIVLLLVPAAAIRQHGTAAAPPFSRQVASPGLVQQIAFGNTKSINQRIVEKRLAPIIAPGSKIVGSNYRTSKKFAFFLEAQIYGKAAPGYSYADPAARAALADAGIDYYIDFTPVTAEEPDLSGMGEVRYQMVHTLPCSDTKTSVTERCLITVVQLTN